MTEEKENSPNVDLEIKRAAQLSLTEICIGSIGHGFKIPLTGHVLSLNQLAFLLNALNKDQLPKSAVFEISGITAILKSFSPAGQKLGPMLSISMQGFLFWSSISVVGTNIFGQVAGAILLATWAFIQPLVTLFIIYGYDLINLSKHYLKRLNDDYSFIADSLIFALSGLIIIKLSIASAMAIYSVLKKKEILLIGENRMSKMIMQQIPKGPRKDAFKTAIKDLFKPLFLMSFVLMLVFVWNIEGSVSQKIWFSLRPLAIAFVLFYLLRSEWLAERLLNLSKKSNRFQKIYLKAKAAMEMIAAKIKPHD